MTLYSEVSPGTFREWDGGLINEVRHPRNIEQLWTDAELAELGLYRPAADPTTAPQGHRIATVSVQRVNGVVSYVNTYEPLPLADFPPLTPRQFRLGLLAAGKLAAVDLAIDALPEPQRSAAKIEWEFATMIQRTHPMVVTLSAALQLNEVDVNQLWFSAVGL